MTGADVRDEVAQALASVAPEIDPSTLAADVPFRDQVDLDSMDFLRFVIELHKRFEIEVPETDYPKLASLAGAVSYVEAGLRTRQEAHP